MRLANTASSLPQINNGDLPPSSPWPSTFQTLACRLSPYAYFEHCQARLGNRFTVYPIDLPPLVFLADPEDIHAVLTGDPSQLHPGAGAAQIAPVVGKRSFMLLEDEDHMCGRRTINPAFHRHMVARQSALLTETVQREVSSWPQGVARPLDPQIRALTLRVILQVIFGDDNSTLQPLHARVLRMLSVTLSILLQQPKFRRLPGQRARWRLFLRERYEVDELIYQLIARRRAETDLNRGDLLDMLLAGATPDGQAMTDREVRDNLMSMIVAGHETTTGELAWAFQLLAHNPSVQDRLIEDLDSGGDEYLTATVHETLRRKPVFVFAIPRKVIAPIEIGAWTYDPPAHLAACTYLMHHNPDLYPQPHEFRPERFIGNTQRSGVWLPWGGGRKHCVGRHFALLEVKAILRETLVIRRVLPASSHIERPRWRSPIVVPHAGSRVILRTRRR